MKTAWYGLIIPQKHESGTLPVKPAEACSRRQPPWIVEAEHAARWLIAVFVTSHDPAELDTHMFARKATPSPCDPAHVEPAGVGPGVRGDDFPRLRRGPGIAGHWPRPRLKEHPALLAVCEQSVELSLIEPEHRQSDCDGKTNQRHDIPQPAQNASRRTHLRIVCRRGGSWRGARPPPPSPLYSPPTYSRSRPFPSTNQSPHAHRLPQTHPRPRHP